MAKQATCQTKRKLRVIIVRHGQTLYNNEIRFRGMLDIPLDETGHRQAELSAAFVRDALGAGLGGAVTIYSSPLVRAMATAAPLAALLDAPKLITTQLQDVDVGQWQGALVSQVEREHPSEYDGWTRDPARFTFPGGESMVAVRERGAELLDRIAGHGEGDFVLFTHQVPAKLLIAAAIGAGPESFWRLRVDNAAVSVLEHQRGYYAMTLFNATSHLRVI